MSFASDWLDLREPADRAGRDPGLLDALTDWVGGHTLRAADLGCGTGANWRALSPRLPALRWSLIDNDPRLLAEAARRTGAQTRRLDLAAAPGEAARAGELVTASALFDLVSAEWLARFLDALPRHAAIYAALNYDGHETWTPEPPHEAEALAAFHGHQRGDKGFGPALGPQAGAALAAGLAARGWRVFTARSPWRLGADHAALRAALAEGAAGAVAETGALPREPRAAWAAGRRAARRVEIGHLDVLALPA
ncbi:MAG: methyltransferase domain-containing protein [Pseudomonadota bacterium]